MPLFLEAAASSATYWRADGLVFSPFILQPAAQIEVTGGQLEV